MRIGVLVSGMEGLAQHHGTFKGAKIKPSVKAVHEATKSITGKT